MESNRDQDMYDFNALQTTIPTQTMVVDVSFIVWRLP